MIIGKMSKMEITIVEPQGYCAGVTNAINIAYKARKDYPNSSVVVLGMLVHNQEVVNELSEAGIRTYFSKTKTNEEMIRLIPKGSVVIFTAHGHDEKLDIIAKERNLIIYDTTCPKVKNNLDIIKKEINVGHQVIYIGHKNHPEALAALSINENVIFYDMKMGMKYKQVHDDSPLVINQTTLNIDMISSIYEDIKKHFPDARVLDEICNTTRLRQEAVKNLKDVDLIIVVGDNNSSNTRRLYEIASSSHPDSVTILVSNYLELDESLFANVNHVAIASGASTPKKAIDEIVNFIKSI